MYCDVTLTANEFKEIHNTLWELQYKGMTADVGAARIRAALKGAYEQEDADFKRRREHYDSVMEDLGLDAIWSVYEVADLNAPHPFAGAKTVLYRDHWGDNPVSVEINGLTWAALYVSANAAIRDSGDEHHVFIEQFTQSGDELILSTGS
jgi:hypothetical protein